MIRLCATWCWDQTVLRSFPLFADLLDGACEDVDRLLGQAGEYQVAAANDLTLQQYRDLLTLPSLPEGQKLAFLLPSPS